MQFQSGHSQIGLIDLNLVLHGNLDKRFIIGVTSPRYREKKRGNLQPSRSQSITSLRGHGSDLNPTRGRPRSRATMPLHESPNTPVEIGRECLP